MQRVLEHGFLAPEVCEALSSWLGKALVKCFADDSEAVRTGAINLFSKLIRVHSDAVLPMLPYVMPVLEERLQNQGKTGRMEQCEELRLSLIEVLQRTHSCSSTYS